MADVLSPERLKYEAAKRNQASIQQVNELLVNESNALLGRALGFDQQQLGGFLRQVVPGLVDKYGNINGALALQYYDEQRLIALTNLGSSVSRQVRKGLSRKAERVAAAMTQGQIYKATLAQLNPIDMSEPIIGWGMQRFMEEGHDAMVTGVNNAMTRAVASYNRDTILYNAGLDPAVMSVQRVAEPTACGFCQLMAFRSNKAVYRSDGSYNMADNVRTADYAIDFHDNCHCSIETLYLGDKPIVPDYYAKFEQNYRESGGDLQELNAIASAQNK